MTYFPQLIAALAMAASFAHGHQHLACVGAPEFEHYFAPSPQSCRNYVLCINGEAHIGECGEGHAFDVGQQGCATETFVDCIQCGPFGFVKLPHKEDCSQYYECTFGQRKLRTCPQGFLFDRTVGTCNNDFMVTTCPGMEFPDDDGAPGLEPPGDGTDPTGPDGPSGPLPSCLTGQVHHAHSSDCNRYFLCVRGNLWEHSCPSYLHWNERAMACDLVEHAGCINAGGGENPEFPEWGDGPGGPGIGGPGPGGPGIGGPGGNPPAPEFPEWTPFGGKPGKKPVGKPGQRPRPPVRGTEPIRRMVRTAAEELEEEVEQEH